MEVNDYTITIMSMMSALPDLWAALVPLLLYYYTSGTLSAVVMAVVYLIENYT